MSTTAPRDMLAPLGLDVARILSDSTHSLEERSTQLHNVLGVHAALLYVKKHGRMPDHGEAGDAVQALLERIAVQLRAHLE